MMPTITRNAVSIRFKSYDVLDVAEFHPMWINHSKLFADQRDHINGIENFWTQAKRH